MKSQIQVFILFGVLFFPGKIQSQPKISFETGIGFYEPTLGGFDNNSEISFPTKNILNRNLLLDWGIFYEIFYNTRIGYKSYNSIEIGELDLASSNSAFYRTIRYRQFPLETFFRWKKRIELNFNLAPVWGRCRITVETSPNDNVDDWNSLLNSFGDSNPMSDMGTSNSMISDWFGTAGMIGIRYYLSSRLGLDVKMGFLHNYYSSDNWRLNNQTVKGPSMELDEIPIFAFNIVYGIK